MPRVVRSMTAWILSSGASGRSTSMSSYRRMRLHAPSYGIAPQWEPCRRGDGSGRSRKDDSRSLARGSPMYALARRDVGDSTFSSHPHFGVHVAASALLLVDSDAASAEVISGLLTGVGYTVTRVENGTDAFAKVTDNQLVIIDEVAGDQGPAGVCREIRATPSMARIPVLCISQSDDVEDRIRFLEAGADDVMAKPFDGRELEARVEALPLRFTP